MQQIDFSCNKNSSIMEEELDKTIIRNQKWMKWAIRLAKIKLIYLSSSVFKPQLSIKFNYEYNYNYKNKNKKIFIK